MASTPPAKPLFPAPALFKSADVVVFPFRSASNSPAAAKKPEDNRKDSLTDSAASPNPDPKKVPIKTAKTKVQAAENSPEYEKVAAAAALARASTHYFGLWVPFYLFKVGFDKVEFVVHVPILLLRCPSFERRISKCSSEDKITGGSIVVYKNELPSTFSLFVTWLHTGLLIPTPASSELTFGDEPQRLVDRAVEQVKEPGGNAACPEELIPDLDLARLFTFANRKKIPELKLTAVAILHFQNHQQDRTTTKDAIRHLLDHRDASTESDLDILKYLVEEAVVYLAADNVTPNLFHFPNEYVQAILQSILAEREKNVPLSDRMSRGAWSDRSVQFYYGGDHGEDEVLRLEDTIASAKIRPLPSPDVHLDYKSTVVVVVGSECLRFRVHTGLLWTWSDFFREALGDDPLNAKQNEIDLKRESVRDFALFLDFMYEQQLYLPSITDHQSYEEYSQSLKHDLKLWKQHRNFKGNEQASTRAAKGKDERPVFAFGKYARSQPAPHDESSKAMPTSDSNEQHVLFVRYTQDMLVNLFCFSHRCGIPRLRNRIINTLAQQRESGWPWISASSKRVRIAFSTLPSDSALCRFLVDEAAWCWDGKFGGANDMDDFPDQFCAKVMKRWMRHGGQGSIWMEKAPWRKDVCKIYHDHVAEDERTECQQAMRREKWTKELAYKTGMEPVARSKS